MKITLNKSFHIPEAILSTETAAKKYHLAHPELQLDVPSEKELPMDYIEIIIKAIMPDNTIPLDYQRLHDYSITNYMDDGQLNDHNTNIYASIHPNYGAANIHSHSYYEVFFVMYGSCTNYCDNQILSLTEGDMLIMAPGTKHAISSFSDDCRGINIALRALAFEDAFFQKYQQNDIISSFFYNVLNNYKTNTFILFHTGNDHKIKSNIINILEEQSHYHRYGEELKLSYNSIIFMLLIDRYEGTAEIFHFEIEKNHDITLILRYMQQNYKTLNLKDLATFFGYSYVHMSRIIKQYTGKSFQKNLQQIRMLEAIKYMKEGCYSLEEISIMVGYSSSYNFREIFKQEFGILPHEYKKKLQ